MKGSIIELANGDFKRVEDMRTEDFMLSVKNSSKLELKDSTVVKITPTSNQIIVITFSFDKNRSQVSVDFCLYINRKKAIYDTSQKVSFHLCNNLLFHLTRKILSYQNSL